MAEQKQVKNGKIGCRSEALNPARSWFGVTLAVALTVSSNFAGAALADDDPQFKSDTPKLDTNIPKSTILKGGVKHEEQTPQTKQKLTGAATGGQAQSGLSHFKLFSSKAKADKQRALEAQTRNNALLNSQVASGIGIIGVKFVLAFGRPPVINRVFPGTPAAVVGLRNNDVIVAVDGIPTYGLTKEEVYQMIVGSPGTPVTVTVSRNGDYVPRTMNRMDFNDITDPIVRRDYLMSI